MFVLPLLNGTHSAGEIQDSFSSKILKVTRPAVTKAVANSESGRLKALRFHRTGALQQYLFVTYQAFRGR